MKSCPDCNRTFEDTFTFCLVDGSILSAPFAPGSGRPDTTKASNEAPPTEVLSTATPSISETVPSPVPPPAPTIRAPYQPSPPVSPVTAAEPWVPSPAERKPNTLAWVIGGLALLAIIGVILVFRSGSSPTTTASSVSNNMAAANANMAAIPSSTATPDQAKAHLNKGNVFKDEKRYAEAEAEFRESIRLNPNDTNTHTSLAYVLTRLKRNAEAVDEYRLALKVKPDMDSARTAALHYNIGKALQDQEKFAEAETEYREAIRLDANMGSAHMNLGLTLYQMKRYPEAESELRESVRLTPNDAAPHHNLAIVLEAQNKSAEARAEYAKADKFLKQASP